MTDDPRREKQRARWRRNKANARARVKPGTISLSDEFVARVMDARDRRSSRASEGWALTHPSLRDWSITARYLGVFRWTWLGFTSDVWAATILLEAQLGPGTATPTKIARWLSENDREHGYGPGSLRTMVYRARPFIAALEAAAALERDGHAWAPFDGCG